MIEINADAEAIIKRAILSFVATVNDDVNAESFAEGIVDSQERCSLLRRYRLARDDTKPETQPAVEINVIDIFQRRGYRFKGHASILPPGDDEYSMIADWVRSTNGPEYPVDHVVRIETLRSLRCCRRRMYSRSLLELRMKSGTLTIKKYGVKRIGE